MARRRTIRLSDLCRSMAAGFVALPLAVAPADGPEPKPAPELQKADNPSVPILRGRVTSKAGVPLPNARVRVAIPAADMRFIDESRQHQVLEARSDAEGDYRLAFPGLAARTTISIDASSPGFRRLVGTLMAGGDARKIEVEPGKVVDANLELEPARYLGGLVVDEQGQPIPSAEISANFVFDQASGGIERTRSGPDGSFELFNYPTDLKNFRNLAGKGVVFFSHPDFIPARIDDIDAIEPGRSGELRIVLPTGRKLAGRVLDLQGNPVRDAMVEVLQDDGGGRKATLTDENGRFALRGLEQGPKTLAARSLPIKQKTRLPMALGADKDDLEIRLQAMTMPADLKSHAMLGMQLADMSQDLKAAYDTYFDRGALILNPGQDFDRLKLGHLEEGYLFWMVGNKRVGSVREFVDQILTEAGGGDLADYSIRVVFSFKTPEMVGNNTQYMTLTRDDIRQLQAIADQIPR